MARYGGEEFIILLPSTCLEQASQTAERLRSGIASAPMLTNAGQAEISVSVGVAALAKGEKLTLDELINRADQMLYLAKDLGRNLVCVWRKD